MAMEIGAASSSTDEVMVEMNTTPLIDVMLVLLIMLIITIPIQLHAVNLNMPTAKTPMTRVPPMVVTVVVAADGQLTWNTVPMLDRASLEQRLRGVAALAEQPELHLRPHKDAPYKVVAMVLASAQRLGVNKLGIEAHEQFAR